MHNTSDILARLNLPAGFNGHIGNFGVLWIDNASGFNAVRVAMRVKGIQAIGVSITAHNALLDAVGWRNSRRFVRLRDDGTDMLRIQAAVDRALNDWKAARHIDEQRHAAAEDVKRRKRSVRAQLDDLGWSATDLPSGTRVDVQDDGTIRITINNLSVTGAAKVLQHLP